MRRDVRAKLFGTPAEPVRVGRYRVKGVLGEGGMGIVYLAEDEDLGREVAIKVLRPEIAAEGGARLQAEAKSLARLSSPHVVGVFDVGEWEGRRFIAMEYVPGQTLRHWLELPHRLEEVLDAFVQAGRGLAAAHAVGLVHRDFKPDNVLVGDDGRARVLDFGLARPPDPTQGLAAVIPAVGEVDPLATSLTREGALLGTPAYMAPEQHLGEPAGPASDQFAFAIALHDAVYGHRPFAGEDLRTLSLSIVASNRRPVSTAGPFGLVPPALAALIDRALSRDPADRFASMDALLAALESLDRVGEVASAGPDRPRAAELETQAFERALGLDQSQSDGPRLGRRELAAVAEEAGIEVRPAAVEPLPARQPMAPAPARAPGELDGDIPASVLHRELSAPLRPEDAPALSRMLERSYGAAGSFELIGRTFAWSSAAGEVTLAPKGVGSTLVLERRLLDAPVRRRKRLRRWGVGAFFFGLILVNVAELMQHEEPVALLLMFIYTLMGVGVGALVDRRGRRKALAQSKERLGHLAERIDALVAAPQRGAPAFAALERGGAGR